MVSGLLTTVQQFASAAGIAGIGALFFRLLGQAPSPEAYAKALLLSGCGCFALALVALWLALLLKRQA